MATPANITSNEGKRYGYIYVTDAGTSYVTLLDEQVAGAGGFEAATGGEPSMPTKFTMRRVHFKYSDGRSGNCPIAEIGDSVWDDQKQPFTYNGVAVEVTGRTGEKQSFMPTKSASPSPSPSPSP